MILLVGVSWQELTRAKIYRLHLGYPERRLSIRAWAHAIRMHVCITRMHRQHASVLFGCVQIHAHDPHNV